MSPPSSGDCRCHCGNLLARLVADGVELKCRRCKRTHVIALEEPPTATRRSRSRAAPPPPTLTPLREAP